MINSFSYNKETHQFEVEFADGVKVTGTYIIHFSPITGSKMEIRIDYKTDKPEHSLYTRKMKELDEAILREIRNCVEHEFPTSASIFLR